MATLHFEGLNNVQYSDLKQEVHNGWIEHGTDTTPKTIEQTLQMCDKYRQKGPQYTVPVKSEDRVAYLQQRRVSKPILGKGGKPIKCFHCGENHRLENCPQINNVKKKEIQIKKKGRRREQKERGQGIRTGTEEVRAKGAIMRVSRIQV